MTKLNDGIVSLATSLGQRSQQRDFAAGRKLTDKTLANLYEHNWIVQKFVDVRTTDMTRLDREVLTPEFDNDIYEMKARRTGAFKAREEALQWTSLYGDSLVLAVTDEENLEKPLQDNETIQRFIVLDKTAYDFEVLETDITSANYGKPRMYKINGDTLIHNSRVCRTEGGKRSFKERTSQLNRYGRSDIQAIKDSLFNYLTVCTNIFDIVEESKSDILYIDDFNMGIAAGREDEYQALAVAMNSIKSSTGSMFLDGKTRWEQKELTFAGLTDIWNQARTDLAGACDIPLTRLFGQSAAGFASGEEDNQKYYESIASLQESRLRPIDDFIDSFLLDELVDYIYPSVELSNETEKSTILTATVGALNTLLQSGIIDEVQFAKELKAADLVNFSDEDITALEELISEPTEEDPTAQIEGSPTEQTIGSVLPQAANHSSGLDAILGRKGTTVAGA